MIKQTFSVAANISLYISRKTGSTYNGVNILVYYVLIPLSWTAIFDCWLGLPIASTVLLFVWLSIFIATRHIFRECCDWIFQGSVNFLNWFSRWGGYYVLNSIIICVLLPLIIYGLLMWLLI